MHLLALCAPEPHTSSLPQKIRWLSIGADHPLQELAMAADANAVQVFQKYPLDFMKQTLVRAPSCQTAVYGRPMALTLSLDPMATAQLAGKAVKVYALRAAEPGEPSFSSYICDFSTGNISYQVLGRESEFCFTFAMDGCTFSVGSPTGTGDVLVSHGNAKGVTEGGDSQVGRQHSFASQLHGGGVAQMLQPGTYRADGAKVATTFGLRDRTGWSFYYQNYVVTKKGFPPGYELFGVYDFSGKKV
ncbi:hypothetical protein GEMMAAP_17710 [Gemmatimonas phototrophica]|uniref:Uncharacterized protein n=2 Tax=Gemmatimonas phototrophica TaxID=1379270 RepID=A0A143BNV5_9BACT|nr:hypothetical protein GEMMAAP_17710 [Gemmatimonas phototrophica]